jgi:AcrR family transcriptional regulator
MGVPSVLGGSRLDGLVKAVGTTAGPHSQDGCVPVFQQALWELRRPKRWFQKPGTGESLAQWRKLEILNPFPMGKPTKSTSVPPDSSPATNAAQRIVAAARREFLAHGFRGVTMDDLAAALGMSKKTFYAHFPGKTELVAAVLRDKLAGVDAALTEIVTRSDGGDFSRTLGLLLGCIQRETQELQPAFLRDLRREAPELWKLVEDGRAEIIGRHFTKLLAGGRRAGRIRRDVPPRLIIEILLAAAQQIVNPVRLEELNLTPQSALESILAIVLEGALTRAKNL